MSTTDSWPLAHQLSNAILQSGTFIVGEKQPDGLIVYKLALNDFLCIDNKKAIPGTGLFDSKLTKDFHLDKTVPYIVHFLACSNDGAVDWTPKSCDLRKFLHIRSDVLYGGDAVPAMVVKRAKSGNGMMAKGAGAGGWETYEISVDQVKAIVKSKEEEGQLEEGVDTENITYESHPEHEATETVEEEFTANGLFGDGAKLGKLINLFIEGDPHPGKIKTRRDAKGHEYFGCEKHEHPVPGNMKISKAICT
jgi:hypothetical protein